MIKKKIVKESEDLDWIEELDYKELLGDLFSVHDVCFNDDSCKVNINEKDIVFNLDLDWLYEHVYDGMEVDYYLKDLMYFNGVFEKFSGNYYDVDSDEINYLHLNNEQKEKINVILTILGLNLDINKLIEDQNLRSLEDYLPSELRLKFDDMQDKILTTMGYSYAYNAWEQLCTEYNRILDEISEDIIIDLGNSENLKIDINAEDFMNKVSECREQNFSCALKRSILDPLFDYNFQDSWYEGLYLRNEDADEVYKHIDDFIEDCQYFIDNNPDIVGDYSTLIKTFYGLGFSESHLGWIKPINLDENKYFLIGQRDISFSEERINLRIVTLRSGWRSWVEKEQKSFIIPFDKLVDYAGGTIELYNED
jgi:hypothetical protein